MPKFPQENKKEDKNNTGATKKRVKTSLRDKLVCADFEKPNLIRTFALIGKIVYFNA